MGLNGPDVRERLGKSVFSDKSVSSCDEFINASRIL